MTPTLMSTSRWPAGYWACRNPATTSGGPTGLDARSGNELLLKHIRDIHKDSRFTYGSPRVHAELRVEYRLPVNLKRVARLMREAGIQGLYREDLVEAVG